jgi:hypothetical protein
MRGAGGGADGGDAGQAGKHLPGCARQQRRELLVRGRERAERQIEPLEVEREPLRAQLGVCWRRETRPPARRPVLGARAPEASRRTREQRPGARRPARERDRASEHGSSRGAQQIEDATVAPRR